MFEAMAGNFVHPEDIQLFLNVITGSLAVHPDEAAILRNIRIQTFNAKNISSRIEKSI